MNPHSKRDYLRQLVSEKNRWFRPLTVEEKALGFLGWHARGYLPHCDYPGLVQFLTFRLADSRPASRRGEWEHLLAIEDNREYWDTFMRHEEQERLARRYIEQNPVQATLCRAPEEWPFSSARSRDAYQQLAISREPGCLADREWGARPVRVKAAELCAASIPLKGRQLQESS